MLKVWPLLVVVSFVVSISACQPGRIAEKVTDLSSSSTSVVPANPINIGNVSSGVPLDVDLNPTPTPTGTGTNTNTVIDSTPNSMIEQTPTHWFASILSIFAPNASAAVIINPPAPAPVYPDKYEIFYSNKLLSQLSTTVGTGQLLSYQTQYTNYLADQAANPNAVVPASLLTPVTVNFVSYKNDISLLKAKVIDFLDPNIAVIIFGTNAWLGKAVVPAIAGGTDIPFSTLSNVKLIRWGTGLKGFGGLTPSGFNRGIFSITFTPSLGGAPPKFTVTASSGTTLTNPGAGVKHIESIPVSLALKTAAGTAGSAWNPYSTVLIAYANLSNQLVYFYTYQLSSPLAPPSLSSVTCASVVSYFDGYTCPSISTGTGTATGTFTDVITSPNN